MNNRIMNIIITGSSGFIGTHLTCMLHNHPRIGKIYAIDIDIDNKIIGYDDARLIYIKASIADVGKLDIPIPDIIFHLGEFSRINKSFEMPDKVVDTNVIGTIQLLEYARRNNIMVVYAASSSVHDLDVKNNMNPYTLSKVHNIDWIKYYHKWYKLSYCILYFYNVYGAGQLDNNMGTVIGKFISQWESNEPLSVVSPGTQTRAFTHIDDTIDAIHTIFDKDILVNLDKGLVLSSSYDIANSKQYSILEIVKMFWTNHKLVNNEKVNRLSSVVSNNDLLLLGWKSKYDLPDYISEIISRRH